jgi:serine protease Do/serine protease DegQ
MHHVLKVLLKSLILSIGIFGQDLFSQLKIKTDDSQIDRFGVNFTQSYASVLADSTPAVVSVTTQQFVKRILPGGGNPIEEFLRRYYGYPRLYQPRIEEVPVPAGIGSGVIVTPDGYTITNAHVITANQNTGDLVEEVLVKVSEKEEYKASIVGYDRSTDVAVLKIDADRPLPFVTLANSENLEVGDVVFAVGNPLGVGKTVTMGIISATMKSELGVLGPPEAGSYENFIQTDASINPGNSGGALLDAKGRLIGINTAIISQTRSSIGIGLAIPINMARKVLTDLVEGGELRRGFLGVDLDETELNGGALINKVIPGSAASRAGLRKGDLILSVGDKEVNSVNQTRIAISQTAPGTKLPLKISRSGVSMTVFVTLGLMGEIGDNILPGVDLEVLNNRNRKKFGIPADTIGVLVIESTGAQDNFKEGVLIVEINGAPVRSLQDVKKNLQRGFNRFYVWYLGKYRFVSYRMP